MKKLSIFLLPALVLTATPASAGLIGYYTFENSDAADSSGNGNDGTLGGGAGLSFSVGGGVGGGTAAQFSGLAGTANLISLPININPGVLPNLTMGAFVDAGVGITAFAKVLSQDNGGFDRTLGVDTRGGTSGAFAAFSNTGAGVLNSNILPTAGVGYDFIAVRYGSGQVTLTVNGTNVSSAAANGSGNALLYIGGNPGFNENWTGLIDNVFVYDEVLSDADLQTIRVDGGIVLGQAPEPLSLVLIGGGLAAIAGMARRRA